MRMANNDERAEKFAEHAGILHGEASPPCYPHHTAALGMLGTRRASATRRWRAPAPPCHRRKPARRLP